jgi:hypothetical protein
LAAKEMTAKGDTKAVKSKETPRSDGVGRPTQVVFDMQIPGQLKQNRGALWPVVRPADFLRSICPVWYRP